MLLQLLEFVTDVALVGCVWTLLVMVSLCVEEFVIKSWVIFAGEFLIFC